MSEKATLYFVITKVIAPKGSFFNLVLSVDNSKTILKSPRSRSNAYTIPYKIMKEVSILDNKDQIYNIEIIFYDKDQPVINGSVNINIKDFFKASSIELKQYDLNVQNIDNISVFVGVALVPIGEPFLPDFDIYGNSAKIVSKDDSDENQSTAQNSPVNDKLEREPEIVESESGKKHRRKKGTTDNECITFISQSGRSHKKHRIYSIPEHSPSFDQKVDDEEIIRSESGSPHRRKRGTKDTKAVTFISEGGHEHRKRRSHHNQTNEMENQQIENKNQNETQNKNQQNETQNQKIETQNQDQQNENKIQDQQNENKIQDQQNEIQNQDQQNEDQNQQQHHRKRRSRSQQQQEKTENEVVEIEKERSSTDSKVENAVSEGSSSRRRKRTSESQPAQQEEQQQQQQQQEKTRKRRHRKTESEEKNEEKQKEEEEVTTNSTTENRRRRKRKEKSTTDDGETETSSTKTEKH